MVKSAEFLILTQFFSPADLNSSPRKSSSQFIISVVIPPHSVIFSHTFAVEMEVFSFVVLESVK